MTDQTPTTPDAGPTDLDEQTAADVANLAALTKEIADRKEVCDDIKARLRDRLPLGRRYAWQGREVLDLAAPGAQFDAALAEQVVPAELLPAISTTKPDATKAKAILPAALYAQCCKPKAAAVKPL